MEPEVYGVICPLCDEITDFDPVNLSFSDYNDDVRSCQNCESYLYDKAFLWSIFKNREINLECLTCKSISYYHADMVIDHSVRACECGTEYPFMILYEKTGLKIDEIFGFETDEIEVYIDNLDSDSDSDLDAEYEYRCSICDRGFNDQFDLGNHVMRRHDDYNSLLVLDRKRQDGFPGFEVLKKIGMIDFVHKLNTKSNENCIICNNEYTDLYSRDEYISIDQDYDVLCHTTTKNRFKVFNDDTKSIYVNSLSYRNRYKLILTCCKANLCTECLKKHINSKCGDPICRHSHEETDKQFVVFDERPKAKIQAEKLLDQLIQNINFSTEIDTCYDSDESSGSEVTIDEMIRNYRTSLIIDPFETSE